MTCQYLEYRRESGEKTFDADRAYCGVVERFVEPMRADVCNDRYALHHADHCEIFREQEENGGADEGDGGAGENGEATGRR